MADPASLAEPFLSRLLPHTHVVLQRLKKVGRLKLTPYDIEDALGITCSNSDAKHLQRACNAEEVESELLLSVMRAQINTYSRAEAVDTYNEHAVVLLARADVHGAFALLDAAQRLLDVTDELNTLVARTANALTANNLACCYKREGDLSRALHHLRRAEHLEGAAAKASTQLNLCAVLVSMAEHPEAVPSESRFSLAAATRAHGVRALRLVEVEVASAGMLHVAAPTLKQPPLPPRIFQPSNSRLCHHGVSNPRLAATHGGANPRSLPPP